MPPRVDTLRESTHRVVRTVALGHLADATAARGRLAESADEEALHDFRVALRRLRSWERAFRPYIRKDVPGKLRRRLRNLARDTGESRDLEVHLEWLREQRRAVGRRQRPGLNWLVASLTERKAAADVVLDRDVEGKFSRLRKRLERALASYRETLRLLEDGRAAPPPTFAEALAPRVRDAAAALASRLAHIQSVSAEDECHEARIAAKRLRYLLEPITRLVPGADDAVNRLKSLQDVLGDLHDAQVFGAEISALQGETAPTTEPDTRPAASEPIADPATRVGPPAHASLGNGAGTDAPAERTPTPPNATVPALGAPAGAVVPMSEPPRAAVTATEPRAAAATEPRAVTAAEPRAVPAAGATVTGAPAAASQAAAPDAPDLAPGLAVVRDRLSRRATTAFAQFSNEWLGDRSAGFFRELDAVADRIEEGGRAGIEIERKYLLRSLPDEVRTGRWMDIVQGYVPGTALHERIRRVSVRVAGRPEHRFYRTVKVGEGVARMEIEEETTAAIFEAMWPLTSGHRLRKRRYAVDVDGKTWEIDAFRNRDLVLAEIELDAEDEKVVFPKWLAAVVQREVTLEPAFQNINLAR